MGLIYSFDFEGRRQLVELQQIGDSSLFYNFTNIYDSTKKVERGVEPYVPYILNGNILISDKPKIELYDKNGYLVKILFSKNNEVKIVSKIDSKKSFEFWKSLQKAIIDGDQKNFKLKENLESLCEIKF